MTTLSIIEKNHSSKVPKFQKLQFVNLNKEKFSSYSHFFGAVASFMGTVILIIISAGNLTNIIVSSIYGLSVMFLFTSSGLYHAFKKKDDEISVWRKLDHIAIFVMIAGTFTPISFIYLKGYWRWGMLIAQWGLVLSGLILKLFILNTPRWITTGIYLLQGWMAILPIYLLISVMSLSSLILLILGGLSFTIGAVFYIKKKPNPLPGVFGFHEIFHVWILIGAFFHYLTIFLAIY